MLLSTKEVTCTTHLEVTKGTADLRCGTTVAEVKAGEGKSAPTMMYELAD